MSSTILVKSPEFGYGGIGIATSKLVRFLLEESFSVCVHTTLRSKRIADSQTAQRTSPKIEAVARSVMGFTKFNPVFDLLSSMHVGELPSLVLRPVPVFYLHLPLTHHGDAPELVIVHDCILDFRRAASTLKEKDLTERLLSSPLGTLMLRSERSFLREAAKIVAVSRHTKKRLVCDYNIDPQKIVVIYNSVDVNRFRRRKPSQPESEIGEEIQIFKEDGPLAVFVGRPQGLKNLDLLLRAAERLHNKIDLKFLVVGIERESCSESQLRAMKRHSVFLAGYVENIHMQEVYSLSDLLIITSANENLPTVLIEAMACGAIPLSTRVGGVPEVIEDGRNGFLVTPNNVEKLESKLREILALDGKTLDTISGRAEETVRTRFTDEIAKKAYVDLINEMTG